MNMKQFKLYTIFILLMLINIYCKKTEHYDPRNINLLTNYERIKLGLPLNSQYLSLINTIGEDKSGINEEYLIVAPVIIRIFENGDILTFDENKIKIYNNNGFGKMIFGKKGNGPGEFSNFPLIRISNNGIITAVEYFYHNIAYYSIFDQKQNYKLIFKKKFEFSSNLLSFLKKNGFSDKSYFSIMEIQAIDSISILYHISDIKNNLKDIDYYSLIAYESKKKFVPLYFKKYKDYSISSGGETFSGGAFSGSFLWNIVSDSLLFYSDPDEVIYYSEKNGEYTLHLLNIYTRTDEKIIQSFIPYLFSDEYMAYIIPNINRNVRNELLRKKIIDAYKQKRYKFPITYYNIDRNYLFIFLFNSNFKDVSVNLILHIFDTKTKKMVFTGESPFWQSPDYIHNSLAYNIENNQEGYKVIRIYKIDPSLYGLNK